MRGKQVVISVGHRGRGYAYPILVSAPVTDLLLGAWGAAQVAWRAVASESKPSLTHRAYGDYGVWSGGGHRRYTATSSGQYRAAAPPGAYIYKLTESGVIHTLPNSQEFGGIAQAGSQRWETAGRWSGPDGQGAGAHHGTRTALSDVTYTYCAVRSCSPTEAVDPGNAAVFGLSMLGANTGDTPTVGLIDDATVYEADKGPVVLGTPRHHGYTPGRWVSTAVDTVTGDAAESRGLGIASLRLLGTGVSPVLSASPRCSGNGLATCPHTYSASLSYRTANMPEGRDTVWEQAVSAGGTVSGAQSWSVNVDRKQPTIALSGGLATENNATISPGTYALRIDARDTDGSTPTSGVAQITVQVDGALQSEVSDFSPCSFGSQCRSVASAGWTLDTAHYPAGTHKVTVQATDSAGNAASATITVTIAPRAEKMYWGADIGQQFTGSTPPFDMNAAKAFANEDAGGKMPSILPWGESFYSPSYCVSTAPYPNAHDCQFQTNLFNAVRQQGFIPMLNSGSSDDSNYSNPNFTDAAVANGSEDAYLTQFAKDAKAWGHPFFLRFDWEMNGPWWSFGTGRRAANQAPLNQPADFVAMWRHIHDIFTRVGATNVTWVWCPNYEYSTLEAPLASVYPGDAYVDWTCIDAYNADNPWTSFQDIFAKTYQDVAGTVAPTKPMIVGETASTASGGSKPQWIADMFKDLAASFPKIRGWIWYEMDALGPGGKTDWAVEGPNVSNPDTASIAAFTAGVGDSSYTTNTYSQLNSSPIPPPT